MGHEEGPTDGALPGGDDSRKTAARAAAEGGTGLILRKIGTLVPQRVRFCTISSLSLRIRVLNFLRRTYHTTVGAPMKFHSDITCIVGGDTAKGLNIRIQFLG